MFELMGILALVFVGVVVFGVVALVAGLLKFVLKIALIPMVLLFKGLGLLLGALVILVVAGPVVLGVGLLLLLPLLLIGGVVWAGFALVT